MEPTHLCYMAGSAACWLLHSRKNSNQFKHVCVPVSWQELRSLEGNEELVCLCMERVLLFFVCISCSPLERQECFCPLPTCLRLLQPNSRFSVAQTTSATASALHSSSVMGTRRLFWVPHLPRASRDVYGHVGLSLCVSSLSCSWEGAVEHKLSRLFVPCCLALGVTPCTRYPYILCRFLDIRLAG